MFSFRLAHPPPSSIARPSDVSAMSFDAVFIVIASAINQIEPLNTRNYTESLISVCFRVFPWLRKINMFSCRIYSD